MRNRTGQIWPMGEDHLCRKKTYMAVIMLQRPEQLNSARMWLLTECQTDPECAFGSLSVHVITRLFSLSVSPCSSEVSNTLSWTRLCCRIFDRQKEQKVLTSVNVEVFLSNIICHSILCHLFITEHRSVFDVSHIGCRIKSMIKVQMSSLILECYSLYLVMD